MRSTLAPTPDGEERIDWRCIGLEIRGVGTVMPTLQAPDQVLLEQVSATGARRFPQAELAGKGPGNPGARRQGELAGKGPDNPGSPKHRQQKCTHVEESTHHIELAHSAVDELAVLRPCVQDSNFLQRVHFS